MAAGVSDILLRRFSLEHFKKIQTFTDSHPDAQTEAAPASYQEGLIQLEQGEWQPALAPFRKVLSIHENAEIHYNPGYINPARVAQTIFKTVSTGCWGKRPPDPRSRP